MALSPSICRARTLELREAREFQDDLEFLSQMLDACDQALIALNGRDALLFDRDRTRLVSQSAIGYWLTTKEHTIAALARRRSGVPRRHMYDCD